MLTPEQIELAAEHLLMEHTRDLHREAYQRADRAEARVAELENFVALMADHAVINWDDAVVAKCDAVVKRAAPSYPEWARGVIQKAARVAELEAALAEANTPDMFWGDRYDQTEADTEAECVERAIADGFITLGALPSAGPWPLFYNLTIHRARRLPPRTYRVTLPGKAEPAILELIKESV